MQNTVCLLSEVLMTHTGQILLQCQRNNNVLAFGSVGSIDIVVAMVTIQSNGK